ncbi:putative GOLD domain-containing protein [Dioscorea sansibarensis]
MASSSKEGLVPITRAFLARYYDKYPPPPLSEDVARLTTELRRMADRLLEQCPLKPGEELLAHEADLEPPHKVDENLWKNREHIEEILFLLEKSHWPTSLQKKATTEEQDIASIIEGIEISLCKTLKKLEMFQTKNAENVFNTVMTYMPQDFRGSLIRQQRERSERNKQAEVDALVNSGGSIRDRYALLWKQQMERRRQLALLGSATGVYKTLVKYLVGVPQVLLDFVRQINDDQGPMEEQRQRYGPCIYRLTTFVLTIRLFLFLSWGRFDLIKLQKDEALIVEQAVHVYTSEFERVIIFIGEVFANSPFFISAEDAGAAESSSKVDDYKEIVIAAGKTYEVTLTVDSVNSFIAWDFALIQGTLNLDVGFRVEYVSPSGVTTLILPYRRYERDQGNFCTILAGTYKLVWDNSYSSFFKKSLRYKVDAIPAVVEPAQPPAETE